MVANGTGQWIAIFDAWSGGNSDELETYLVDTYLRPNYTGANWRNFQYSSLKKPYLTAGAMWWFATNPINDRPGGWQALTLIKETGSANSVNVILMGYW